MALYEINPNNMRGSGDFFLARAGEALGRCALVYKHANGAWYLADADAAATMPTLGITMDRATVAGQIVRILDKGFIGRTTWTWTTGGEIYASTTPGELTQTAPAGSGDVVQVIAMATSPRIIKFSSDLGNRGGPDAVVLADYTIRKLGTLYEVKDEVGQIVNSSIVGGLILNDTIDRASPDGGMIALKCLVTVDDRNIDLLDSDSTIIFQGIGSAGGNTVAQMVTRCRSGIYINGDYFIDNGFAAWNPGRFKFQDMGLLFNGKTTDTNPNVNLDYARIDIRGCSIGTQNCTYSADGVPGVISIFDTSPPTPTTTNVVYEDNWILLLGANAAAFVVQYEDTIFRGNTISFNGTDQYGYIGSDVGATTVTSANNWLGANAEGCRIFQIWNREKHFDIGNVTISDQAGAGSTTPNIVFGIRAGAYDNDRINYVVRNVHYTNWTVTPTAASYAFESADVQERTFKYGVSGDEPNQATEYAIFPMGGGTTDNLLTDGTNEYFPLMGVAPKNTEAQSQQPAPYDMIIKNMTISLPVAPGAGNSRTFTLRVAGGAGNSTVTISDANTLGRDDANYDHVTADTLICVESDGGVSVPAASSVKVTAVGVLVGMM